MRSRLYACALLSAFAIYGCGDDDEKVTPGGNAGSGGTAGATSTGGGPATGGSAGTTNNAGTAGSTSDVTQAMLDGLAQSLDVQFAVIANVPAICPESAPWALCLEARLSLTNTGDAFNGKDWKLYYSGIRKILASENPEFTITHLNGDLHVIEPTELFNGFPAGGTKNINLQAEYWMLSETDVMPRFYVAAPGLTAKAIADTDTEDVTQFVAPLLRPENTRRAPGDLSVIQTAGTRYTENALTTDRGADAVASEIVPKPRSVTAGAGTLDLAAGVRFSGVLTAGEIAALKARMTGHIDVVNTGGVEVNVTVDATNAAFTSDKTAEGYTLEVGDAGVTIVGIDAAGAFYGAQSLVSLLPGNAAVKTIPKLTIDHDAPRYGYRGAQLDLARNFHGVETVKKVLDQMAAYKLNTLHLHLSDDEGWRLEIPALPELTTVGAKRCHDLTEQTCLIPQLGSGPDTTTSGTGNLTRAEFIDILKTAKDRHIEVIPEFDMPGHARAAIKAMEARKAATGDTTYLLSDPDDKSVYKSIQNYKDNALNACMDSTYAFIAKVMDEVLAMYTEAGVTLRTWHAGGDEVAPGAWVESPICKTLFANGGAIKSAADLQPYFAQKVNDLAKARSLGLRGWQDGLRKTVSNSKGDPVKVFLDPATELPDNTISVNYWTPTFWWGNEAPKLANAGYKVILTNPDYLYLDHPYEPDPKERGYYWATRFTSVKKLFSYVSSNIPSNSQLYPDRMGADYQSIFVPIPAGTFEPSEFNPVPIVPLTKPENYIGLEGAMWGETMRTAEQLEYMVFPRLLALAERAWSTVAWEPADRDRHDSPVDKVELGEDWERFANTLGYKELPRLERTGVRFRIEVPGAKIESGKLDANIAMPGLTIQYKIGEGAWTNYDSTNPPTIGAKDTVQVRAIASEERVGRSISVP